MTAEAVLSRIYSYENGLYIDIKWKCRFCPTTKAELQTAVNVWCFYNHNALKEYGDIGTWDVSNMTDFSYLFKCNCSKESYFCLCGKQYFNDNINDWDVSNATTFKHMFWKCKTYNQPLNKWKTNNATNMCCMFAACTKFNQDITNWNVSNVTYMKGMFIRCCAFHQEIGIWNLHSDVEVYCMFGNCGICEISLSDWIVKNDTHMFYKCQIDDENRPKIRMNNG
jgi:surface protein